jgi:hypothetical protein
MEINATKCRITTSVPVLVNGIPTTITRQAAGAGPQLVPTDVTVISPTVFDVGYAAALVATDIVTIPGNVPQVRTSNGGYLAASQKTF